MIIFVEAFPLSFMMGVTTLSLPSMIMLKKAIKPKLLNKKEKRRKIWDYLDLVREWKKKQRQLRT